MDEPYQGEICTNPECCHDEQNFAATCAQCTNQTGRYAFSLLIRRYGDLPAGSVAGYCPLCGITVYV